MNKLRGPVSVRSCGTSTRRFCTAPDAGRGGRWLKHVFLARHERLDLLTNTLEIACRHRSHWISHEIIDNEQGSKDPEQSLHGTLDNSISALGVFREDGAKKRTGCIECIASSAVTAAATCHILVR